MQRQLWQELAQGSMRDPGLVRDLKEAIEPLAAVEKGLLDERRALRALLQTQAAGELGGLMHGQPCVGPMQHAGVRGPLTAECLGSGSDFCGASAGHGSTGRGCGHAHSRAPDDASCTH